MISCVFPGSFDPVTVGHADLITRAAELFDRVYVTVMVNIRKKSAIPADERVRMLEKVCLEYPNVIVDRWDGLLADYMEKNGQRIVIRGLRQFSEYEHELISASVNRMLNGKIETIFLPSDPKLACVSSSVVKEIADFGGEIRGLVPDVLLQEIRSYLSK